MDILEVDLAIATSLGQPSADDASGIRWP